MAKAPSFPFYVKDWLCDPELRLASVLSRGAWIDCLCFMWENSQRGKLTATPLKFARLISGSLDEALHFLNDMNDNEFGDIEVPHGVTFPLTEYQCNVKVTIINRRMYADYKNKQNTRLRVKRHREKKGETPKKQECNGDVTPSSPSSSSFTSSKDDQQADFFKNTLTPYFKSIERSSLIILKFPDKKGFNPCQFTNQQINKKKAHPGAVDHVLKQMTIYWETIDNPNGYAVKILKKENGNFWERENIADHEAVKVEYAAFIEASDKLKALAATATKGMK